MQKHLAISFSAFAGIIILLALTGLRQPGTKKILQDSNTPIKGRSQTTVIHSAH
jgi:hypothetical protein